MSFEIKESSLTTPEDRDLNNKWKPEQGAPVLNNDEMIQAVKELNVTSYIEKFPRVDRTYQDPSIPLQTIGLFSFIPAKGAVPNSKGIYGFAKLRGNYGSDIEASQRAEYIIRNVDSYHKIYHTYVGRPFPITDSSNFSAELSEVDIRKETTESISKSIKDKKEEETKTVREMREREEQMLSESKKNRELENEDEPISEDPFEEYITLSVKKAQVTWTFLEHIKKLHEIRDIIIKTREKIKTMDVVNPEFRDKYFERYMNARKHAGLDNVVRDTQDNFIKFMVEDVEIPTIDNDEILPNIQQ